MAILVVICISSIFVNICVICTNLKRVDHIDTLQRKFSQLSKENIFLEKTILDRDRQINRLRRQILTSPQAASPQQEIVEAVKFAMKAAHPDNGGTATDFIRFRKLYNEMVGSGRQ